MTPVLFNRLETWNRLSTGHELLPWDRCSIKARVAVGFFSLIFVSLIELVGRIVLDTFRSLYYLTPSFSPSITLFQTALLAGGRLYGTLMGC